jgi:hypothetical protein
LKSLFKATTNLCEPAVQVKRRNLSAQIWNIEKFESKLNDMRDVYYEWQMCENKVKINFLLLLLFGLSLKKKSRIINPTKGFISFINPSLNFHKRFLINEGFMKLINPFVGVYYFLQYMWSSVFRHNC